MIENPDGRVQAAGDAARRKKDYDKKTRRAIREGRYLGMHGRVSKEELEEPLCRDPQHVVVQPKIADPPARTDNNASAAPTSPGIRTASPIDPSQKVAGLLDTIL
ncbi:unnamed protein product, partial [Mesorhabditis spiculigera]